jgi:large subunit ribosomal protein L4
MELSIYTSEGTDSDRTVALDASVFDIEPNDHVLWLDVRRIQAAGRQGTAKTKERNEVRGSRRKLYRQKGTGMSRAGDAKSPIRKTGGRTHGARPRSYDLRLSKKTRQLARRSALTYKAADDSLYVTEAITLEAPSTRAVRELLEGLDVDGQKVLILTAEHHPVLYRSSKNLPRVKVKEARNASTVELLDAQAIILEEDGLSVLTDLLRTEEAPAATAA